MAADDFFLSSVTSLKTVTAAYVYVVFSTIAEAVQDHFITWFPPLIVTNVVVNCLFGFGVLVIGQRIPFVLMHSRSLVACRSIGSWN